MHIIREVFYKISRLSEFISVRKYGFYIKSVCSCPIITWVQKKEKVVGQYVKIKDKYTFSSHSL